MLYLPDDDGAVSAMTLRDSLRALLEKYELLPAYRIHPKTVEELLDELEALLTP